MNYLHEEFDLEPEDVVEVTLEGQANVLLLDELNYDHYLKGESYRYHGGFTKQSPVTLEPPERGRWHLVVDLGGYAGRVRAGFRILKGSGIQR